jgi:protein-L-isoaspartate(D-aspartate) O-methyltransferase
MSDSEARRIAMVESQIRPNEVTDAGVLAAMRALPRERFVPEGLRGLAYIDQDIEVYPARDGAPARYLLSPMVQARLMQLAEVEPSDNVLDIGCTTGYSTAILARLAAHVVGLEAEPELAKAARENLTELKGPNSDIVEGILLEGWADLGPYDVILLEGSVPQVPEALFAQLKEAGRLLGVLTPRPNMRQGKAAVFIKAGGMVSAAVHFDAGASPLPGFASAPAFSF